MKRLCTDLKIIAIFEEVKARAQELYPQQFNDCTIDLVVRETRKQLGSCTLSMQNSPTKAASAKHRTAEIAISKYLVGEEAIRKVLIHELGHFVAPDHHHSAIWKERADKIGEKWGIVCHTRASLQESLSFRANLPAPKINPTAPNYVLVCQQCGQIIVRHRRSKLVKHPNRFRCGKCGGSFKLLTNAKQ